MLKLREVIALLGLIATFLVVAAAYRHLPAMIYTPIHGGANAQGLGAKQQLWLFVGILFWIYVLMSLINLVPESVNTSRPLTPEQKRLVWSEGLKLMGWLKAITMTEAAVIVELAIRRAADASAPVTAPMLEALMLLPLFAVVVLGILRMSKMMRS